MKEISRRDFLKGSIAAASLGTVGLLGGCIGEESGRETDGEANREIEKEIQIFENSIEWDDEYDVIVVGYGGAGASAAIKAADSGAKVLIVEKAPKQEAGGNTRVSGGWYFSIYDEEKTLKSLKEAMGEYDDNGGLETIVKNGSKLNDWLISLGADASLMSSFEFYEWPQFYNEGYAVGTLTGVDGDASIWHLLRSAVNERKDQITVWYQTACTRLIQDKATSLVHGCIVETDGHQLSVRAKNGVVLACGGFENNKEMHQNYLNITRIYPIGTPYNTGDGIHLAMEAGADLWHMANYAGCEINFVNPDTGIACGQELTCADPTWGGGTSGFALEAMILVGDDAKRFRREDLTSNHGKIYYHGAFSYLPMPETMYCIFDETARQNRSVYTSWSEGNEEEIAKGWVQKANSVEELAQLIGLDPSALTETVKTYNDYCRDGVDAELGCEPETLIPLTTAPFYAIQVEPTMYNTMGGAKRNARCEIINVRGEIIPHLYGAGEFGSFFGRIDSSGYGMTECLTTGMEAGIHAAEEKTDNDRNSVMAGKEPSYIAPTEEDTIVSLADNEYLGTANGMGGEIKVKVTMNQSTIVKVEILEANETENIGTKALESLPEQFVGLTKEELDSVDVISGATTTSNAIRNAIRDALQ